jgi:hypothetical protein
MTDDVKPWTIKNVPPEDRNAAVAAAAREQMTIGEWLRRAIRAQVQADHGRDRAPTVAGRPPPSPEVFDALDRIVALAPRIEDLPEPVRRAAVSILRQQLRSLRQPSR